MKKYIISLALIGSLSFVTAAQADAPVPGSIDDPVVTKSYMDQRIKEEVAKALGNGGNTNTGNNSSNNNGNTSTLSDNSFETVQLEKGKTLMAEAGTEIIVRRGKTYVVSTDGDSVVDATTGKDVNKGALIENNHLLIFPRETRGIQADAKDTKDIWLMVRGGYTIK
ncbi:hypothetical protein E0485_12645 [Paenibacillus albiflavus]|uniref:Uncharacterized protein n=1 Tax=Paenibacillus albiflavus TaxID=2545760 RepID=A0A4R4EAD5_9BACL|nr:hypothetical protein [Paenibacillus albiflavus]TCZ76826.1 hypothetical protein E0485_12645 [Paenibacillus albiflavus]